MNKKLLTKKKFDEIYKLTKINFPKYKLSTSLIPDYIDALSKDKKNKDGYLGCILLDQNHNLKKYFINIIFLNLFLTKEVFAAESGGMPQLDPNSWVPQIFWLIITFGGLYIVISKIVFPRLSESIEQRNDYVSDLVDEAKTLAEQTEKLNNEYKVMLRNKRQFNQGTDTNQLNDALKNGGGLSVWDYNKRSMEKAYDSAKSEASSALTAVADGSAKAELESKFKNELNTIQATTTGQVQASDSQTKEGFAPF